MASRILFTLIIILMMPSCNHKDDTCFLSGNHNNHSVREEKNVNLRLADACKYLDDGEPGEALRLFCKVIEYDARRNETPLSRFTINKETTASEEMFLAKDLELQHRLVAVILNEESIENVKSEFDNYLKSRRSYFSFRKQTVEETVFSSLYYYWLLFLVGSLTCFLYFSLQNGMKHRAIVVEFQTALENMNGEVKKLTSQNKFYEVRVKDLGHQLESLRDTTRIRLGIGKKIYERVMSGGNMKNISIEDERSFLDYYAFINPENFEEICQKYTSLSLRHTTYLVLEKIGFDDISIQQILYVKSTLSGTISRG